MLGVNENRAGLGLALFAIVSLLGLFGVTWLEVRHNTADGVLETTVAIVITMQSVVVVAAAFVYLTVEGSAMIAERYLKKRFEDGRQIGHQEGRQEGLQAAQAAWTAWHRRWQEARRRGEDFDEPPPELKD